MVRLEAFFRSYLSLFANAHSPVFDMACQIGREIQTLFAPLAFQTDALTATNVK